MQPEVKAPRPAFLELAVSRQHCWTPIMTFYIIPPPAISASQPAWLSPAAAAPLTPCGQHISTQAASRIWNDAWQHWCQESSKGSFEELSPTLPSSHTHTAPRAGEMGELLLCRNSKILRMWAQCYSHH